MKRHDYQSEKIVTFHFLIKKPFLNKQWNRFINGITWEPTQHLVLCGLHFEKHLISRTQICNLKWQLDPVSIIYSAELLKSPSSLSTRVTKNDLFREYFKKIRHKVSVAKIQLL